MRFRNYFLVVLMFFISFKIFSQEFTVKYDFITWTMEFEIPSDQFFIYAKKHPLLRGMSESGGDLPAKKASCDQRGTAIFMRNPVKAAVIIERTDKGYKIQVDNFRFENQTQINLGNVETNVDETPIEDYLLRKKDQTIRKNKQAQKDLQCLSEYLTELFTPK
ncbi:hypothetical protein BTO09_03615 [Gilvibacter sp. SZ-19]|nr:hypothetical protein BTO09_03615 [Gilvibacter sp. SZ-19]